ncbi:MAG: hypothetical protein FJX62_11545 [Alphaproteobacteria bacterium]|nr:hypothetical protein [Alphaproteobacteria bacterium]
MKFRTTIAAALTLLLSAAHGAAHDAKGANGGRVADAGEYHVELVAKNGTIDVFLSDHNDKVVASVGHKALAILVIEGKSQRIALEPAGAGRLSGKASGSLPVAPKGVVQITRPNGKTVQARFN